MCENCLYMKDIRTISVLNYNVYEHLCYITMCKISFDKKFNNLKLLFELIHFKTYNLHVSMLSYFYLRIFRLNISMAKKYFKQLI